VTGLAEVAMNELELLLRTVRGLTGKRAPLELGHHAGVVELLDVVDPRLPSYHLLAPELAQRLKVEVDEALMPAPALVVMASGKAYRPSDLHVEDVEPVAPTIDLSEEAPVRILDLEHPVVDHHLRTPFIELAKAYDGVSQRRDVVDAAKQLVLTRLGHEHHGANTADLDRGLVAKLEGAADAAVQVGEVLNMAGHVVRGAAVEVPSFELVIAGVVAKEGTRTRLVDAEQRRHGVVRSGGRVE
jgi:hypothetical protein